LKTIDANHGCGWIPSGDGRQHLKLAQKIIRVIRKLLHVPGGQSSGVTAMIGIHGSGVISAHLNIRLHLCNRQLQVEVCALPCPLMGGGGAWSETLGAHGNGLCVHRNTWQHEPARRVAGGRCPICRLHLRSSNQRTGWVRNDAIDGNAGCAGLLRECNGRAQDDCRQDDC
jgi:hypothetical protein